MVRGVRYNTRTTSGDNTAPLTKLEREGAQVSLDGSQLTLTVGKEQVSVVDLTKVVHGIRTIRATVERGRTTVTAELKLEGRTVWLKVNDGPSVKIAEDGKLIAPPTKKSAKQPAA